MIEVSGWRASSDGAYVIDSCQPGVVEPDLTDFAKPDVQAFRKRMRSSGAAKSKGRLLVLRRADTRRGPYKTLAFMLVHCDPNKPFLIIRVALAQSVHVVREAQIYRLYLVNCAIEIMGHLPWRPTRLEWRVRDDREARVVLALGGFRKASRREILRNRRFSGSILYLDTGTGPEP